MTEEIPVVDESGEIVENPDLEAGYIQNIYLDTDGEGTLELQKRIYHLYIPEQLEQVKRDKKEQEIAQESESFFLDGGKSKMEQDIKDAAASGGADPALASFAMLAMPMIAPTAKDSALAPVMKYAPEYIAEGHAYKKGEIFKYEDEYWRVSQDFTSQAQWVPGGAGLESLFYRIEIAPDGIIVWQTVYGEYNAPDKGDLRHYPDANGPIYRSLVDDNAYSPDAYPANWELVEDAA